jgi:hypothetical protein
MISGEGKGGMIQGGVDDDTEGEVDVDGGMDLVEGSFRVPKALLYTGGRGEGRAA